MVTLLDQRIISFEWILVGLAIGAAVGAVLAVKIEMTAMPQLVAVFNGFGGLASLLVAGAALHEVIGLPEAGGPYRTPVGTAACVALLVGGAAIGVLATASTIAGLMAGEDAAKEAARAALPDVCDRHACRA